MDNPTPQKFVDEARKRSQDIKDLLIEYKQTEDSFYLVAEKIGSLFALALSASHDEGVREEQERILANLEAVHTWPDLDHVVRSLRQRSSN